MNANIPAFPAQHGPMSLQGLTKREYFAAKCMQALVETDSCDMGAIARDSVKMADALLAELAK